VAPVKFVPVITSDVPPAIGPDVGLTLVTLGTGGATAVNWSAAEVAEVPDGVVTVMSNVPAVKGGDRTVMEVAELIVNVITTVAPKATCVAPLKLVPVTRIGVPPLVGPEAGEMPLTVGLVAT